MREGLTLKSAIVSKSGEELESIYITTFGVRVAIPKSEAMFYTFIGRLAQKGYISKDQHLFFESSFFLNGYSIVA